MNEAYRLALLFYRDGGDAALGQVPVDVDWGPAVEWARLEAIRRDELATEEIWSEATLEPIWHSEVGAPWLEGFRVTLSGNGSGGTSSDFSSAYFRELSRAASARLLEAGKLESGDRFRFVALAFPREGEEPSAKRATFAAKVVAPALELREASVRELARTARTLGALDEADPPVFVPEPLLDEVKSLALQAFPKETGGILVGHLCRDRSLSEIFLSVTAQIHARNAEADSVKLSFTSETWSDVRAALGLRRRGEIMLGWWHSHPVREWCKECGREKREECPLARDFFSSHDRALHRTVFPRAYSIGLVANDVSPAELSFSLHGWRKGLIASRGFFVTGSAAEDGGRE